MNIFSQYLSPRWQKFPREEIERIYAATKKRTTEDDPADTLISVNCS